MAGLPMKIFPGFTSLGLVSPDVVEIAVQFNAEGINALSGIPDNAVAWSEVGTRTSAVEFETKIPVSLLPLLGFEEQDGQRKFHEPSVAAVAVKPKPFQLNLAWPLLIDQSGNAKLKEFLGIGGYAQQIVDQARMLKADIVSSIVIGGLTSAGLSMTAKALTIPQPGLPNGLPLFSDGVVSGSSKHFSNPKDARSRTFANLFHNVGKFTDPAVFGKMITNMIQVPHPSKDNMTLGLGVTDVIGGTGMLIPFWQMAIQALSLQTTTNPGNLAAATTNIYNPDTIRQAGAEKFIGASGLSPWRFWIAPQLDSHPYIVANPTSHMWLAVAQKPGAAWAEIGGPNTAFTPNIQMLGDGTEWSKLNQKVAMLADLQAGGAAGLPHFVQAYFETTLT